MKSKVYIISIIVMVLIVGYFIYKKETIKIKFKRNLKSIMKKYGKAIAINVEKIYRLETNHFKSGQFKNTFSPGMESFGKKYPYGWNTMARVFWDDNILYRPVGFYKGKENQTGLTKTFLKFPNLKAAMFTLAAFLEHYGNNPGRWFSLDKEKQTAYNYSIYKFKTPIYDEINV